MQKFPLSSFRSTVHFDLQDLLICLVAVGCEHPAKHGLTIVSSSSRGIGVFPNSKRHDKSVKFGLRATGMPRSSLKKFWVGILHV